MDKRELLIGGGVVAAALLFVLIKKPSAGGSASNGTTDIMGGFQTADTVYVPTSSYDYQYNTYKGAVTYSTTNQNTTTTYGVPVLPLPAPVAAPPTITTTSPVTVNPVVTPPITNPVAAPAPKAPVTPIHPAAPSVPAPSKTATPTTVPFKAMGNMHYATPKGGYNNNSVVDYIKEHNGYSDLASRTILAKQMGISNYSGTAAQNNTMLSKLKAKYGA